MFWAELIPAGLFFILSFFIIPESPRWLATVQKTTQARAILLRIGGEQYADQTLDELAQLTDKKEEKSKLGSSVKAGCPERAHYRNRISDLPAMVRYQCDL